MHLLNGYSTDPSFALAAVLDVAHASVAWPVLAGALAGSLGAIAVLISKRVASRVAPVKVRKR